MALQYGKFRKLDDMVAPVDRLELARAMPALTGCAFCGGRHNKEKHH